MKALAIIILAIVLAGLNAHFVTPDPKSNVFDPSMLYVQLLGYIVIVIGAVVALIAWS